MNESRQMPPEVRDLLQRIAAMEVKTFDGRRKDWQPIEYLEELGWIEPVEAEHENERARSFRVTDAGKYALERSRRGVDPYLRMTA